MKVSALAWAPFVTDPHSKYEPGFEIDFLNIIETILNCKYVWQVDLNWNSSLKLLRVCSKSGIAVQYNKFFLDKFIAGT